MLTIIKKLFYLFIFSLPVTSLALTYNLPSNNDDLVGCVNYTHVKWGDNFHKIAKRYDIGYDAMLAANPNMNPKSPTLFYKVKLPSEFILPSGPRKGIVVNLAEMRLFYYIPKKDEVMTFPVGIGKAGWATPQTTFHVIQKIKNPAWHVPLNIKKELAAKGINVPNVVEPGPTDPLRGYALRLSDPYYLIHGTNVPDSVGTRASSGCVRLFVSDVQQLYDTVPRGTKVHIIDQPYKAGWSSGKLYLQAFSPINKAGFAQAFDMNQLVTTITTALKLNPNTKVNWKEAVIIAIHHDGIPQLISL